MSTSDKTPILEDVAIHVDDIQMKQTFQNHHSGFKIKVVAKLAVC